MLWNKDSFLTGFQNNKLESSTYKAIKSNMYIFINKSEEYTTAFDVRE